MAAGVHFRYRMRKSLSVAFLAISNQYETFFKLFLHLQNGLRRPFWIPEIHFQMHFWPFQIDTQLNFFLKFLTKWLPSAILDVRNSLSIAFLAISDRYATLIFWEFFDKMAAVGHFGFRNSLSITFLAIWNQCGIFIHFRSHFWPFQIDMQL